MVYLKKLKHAAKPPFGCVLVCRELFTSTTDFIYMDKITFTFLAGLFLTVPTCGQKSVQLVTDTLSGEMRVVEAETVNTSARMQSYDIQVAVSSNQDRPESTADIQLTFGPTVNIDDVFTIVLGIWPRCPGSTCNDQAVGVSYLSTRAINKTERTVNFVMGGMLPEKSYELRASVFGLNGPPCGGNSLEPVYFQTSSAMQQQAKMLLVINEEWEENPQVQAVLDRYISDIGRDHPHIVIQKQYLANSGQARFALYSTIQHEYHHNNLSYLFFIGDNASTYHRRTMLDETGNIVSSVGAYTFTHYTLPLYQHYSFTSPALDLYSTKYHNTCFRPEDEVREAVFQQTNSLISMGMIIPDLTLDAAGKVGYITSYFDKLHKFRSKEILFDRKVLLSDGFVSEESVVSMAEANGRWNSVTTLSLGHERNYEYSGVDVVWKADYISKLGSGSFEIFALNLHGNPQYHSFGIHKEDIIYGLPQLNVQLIDLWSCDVGNFKVANYLAGHYLAKGNVINVHAYSDLLITVTAEGASALEYPFRNNGTYTLLSQGYTFSDALRFSRSYIESDLLLGDPLARLQDSSPLPVVLRNFNVTKEDRHVVLKWSTTSETNADRFEIERSADGRSWITAGAVQARGEGSGSRYAFTDAHPLPGRSFYRLRMIDYDNTFSFSNIDIAIFDQHGYSIYPNPTAERFYIPIQMRKDIRSVCIIDLLGNSVLETSDVSEAGISVGQLRPGLYIVRVLKTDGSAKIQRIIVTERRSAGAP